MKKIAIEEKPLTISGRFAQLSIEMCPTPSLSASNVSVNDLTQNVSLCCVCLFIAHLWHDELIMKWKICGLI